MVIKVRLTKPSRKQSHSFYKTSEIKYQSLSTPSLTKFRMRSTQKLIQFKNPWEQLNKEEVNLLAERLEDKPKDLYDIVKENRSVKRQTSKLKFNRLSMDQIKSSKTPFQRTPRLTANILATSDISKVEKAWKKGFINLEDKISHNKLLQKIKQKRKEYEKQMKGMINDKRLILETDLPKINKIKAVHKPVNPPGGRQSKSKLPVWKLR